MSRLSDKFEERIDWDSSGKSAKSNMVGALVRKSEVPKEIRKIVLHNRWMRFFLILGGPEVKDHSHTGSHAREIFDYGPHHSRHILCALNMLNPVIVVHLANSGKRHEKCL